jgi:hypothetical protein
VRPGEERWPLRRHPDSTPTPAVQHRRDPGAGSPRRRTPSDRAPRISPPTAPATSPASTRAAQRPGHVKMSVTQPVPRHHGVPEVAWPPAPARATVRCSTSAIRRIRRPDVASDKNPPTGTRRRSTTTAPR